MEGNRAARFKYHTNSNNRGETRVNTQSWKPIESAVKQKAPVQSHRGFVIPLGFEPRTT